MFDSIALIAKTLSVTLEVSLSVIISGGMCVLTMVVLELMFASRADIRVSCLVLGMMSNCRIYHIFTFPITFLSNKSIRYFDI